MTFVSRESTTQNNFFNSAVANKKYKGKSAMQYNRILTAYLSKIASYSCQLKMCKSILYLCEYNYFLKVAASFYKIRASEKETFNN